MVLKSLSLLLFFMVLVTLATQSGCAKDYSYEAKPVDSVLVPVVQPVVTNCQPCTANVLPDSSWRFMAEGRYYCGKAEKTVVAPERTAFTFFGPSACSLDSGFVATVYINNEALLADKLNLSARLDCYYYDKVGPSNVYMSIQGEPMQLTIASYNRQTGLAAGTFRGLVKTPNGLRKEISNGAFRIHL